MDDSKTTTEPVLAVNANIPAPYRPYSENDRYSALLIG